jgi:hypothetical protein
MYYNTTMYNDTTRLTFPSSGTTTVPLLFEPQVLRCQASGSGGPPVTVLLDTGTDPSAIDLHLARRLGLNLGEFALGRGAASNAIPYTETLLPWLKIGDLTLRDLFMLALDLRSMPFQVDVVLGYNVLCHLTTHIDYRRSLLSLSHPDLGVPEPSEQGAMLPLTFLDHYPALTNIVASDYCLPLVTIDTGSNGGLTLGPDIAQQLGLRHGTAGVTLAQGAGFGGCRDILRGEVDSLVMGPFTLQRVPMDTPGEGEGELSQPGRANIGNMLLARFASVTLDYGRRLCQLEPV